MSEPKKRPTITRIEFEVTPEPGVILRKFWYKGWKPNDPPADQDFMEGEFNIYAVLERYEKEGWAVKAHDHTHARALRGDVTRIDVRHNADGTWTVSKWPEGWTASDRPISVVTYPADWDHQAAIAWMEGAGWTVHQYGDEGARGWKGKPEPIRSTSAIWMKRRSLEMRQYSDPAAWQNRYTDFAYDGF
jgi:hypothetical protein